MTALSRGRAVVRANPYRVAAAAVAALAAVVVFSLATRLFPYHSVNHDEGVYLHQAAMLLEGQIELHAGDLAAAVRPWFFVEDAGRLYPKYAPVPAAAFAVGTALGEPRLSLALVAAGNAALGYALCAAAWNRRTGALAALALVGSPLFLLSSSVFLPYAPTTLLNLAFAFAYVRAIRRRSVRYAGLAGGAIGLAFFGRPFTAVLFAAPFIVHALWCLWDGRRQLRPEARSRAAVLLTVAAVGTVFVGLTLAYNRTLTGSALLFPYEAFAPLDGPGFGRREILTHSVVYTPELAVRADAHVLWYLLTRWFVLGPIGAALAIVGIGVHVRDGDDSDRGAPGPARLDGRTLRWLFLGVAASVWLGNLAFWGTYNALATITDPTDGLLALFGPFYHFDVLLPLAGFAAAGCLALADRVRAIVTSDSAADVVADPRRRSVLRTLAGAAAVTSVPAAAAAERAVLEPPIRRNEANTDRYRRAYAPFEARDLSNGLVFLPTPYGDWLGHPFQALRNDPDLAGETVYALDRGPADDFAVLDAYPDRDPYRYTYRGEWGQSGDPVEPRIEALEIREGASTTVEARFGLPDRVTSARVALTAGDERAGVDVTGAGTADGDDLVLTWHLDPDEATLGGDGLEGGERPSVPVPAVGTVALLVTLAQPAGATLTYRLELPVRVDDARGPLEAVWPPVRKACQLTTDCGREGTYLPDRPDEHLEGVSIDIDVSTEP